jgi:predicted enzyme related to lactoylglutathione lyase
MEKKDSKKAQEIAWTTWFEIPVDDFDRATTFYETIFQTSLHAIDFGSFKMGIFPHKQVGCALCKGKEYKPGAAGALVYMNANPDLQIAQDRIEAAGGKILQAKKQISPEHGFMALFLDSEGNRLALHSDK